MNYYGDVSGHFRNLRDGNCEVVVVAVIGGDLISVGSCAKRTVRNVTDIDEAKWRDLSAVQKRRFIGCIKEAEPIKFGYTIIDRDGLHSIDKCYLLHENVRFPPDWDLALTAFAYGDLLSTMGAVDDHHVTFEFDQVASRRQGMYVQSQIRNYVNIDRVFIAHSHESKQIQTADCIAGAIAEDQKKGTKWLTELPEDNVYDHPGAGLARLEAALVTHDAEP